MRTIYICKSLISLSLNNTSHLNKTPISLLSQLFISSSPETPIAVADYLIDRHKFSAETASKVSSAVKYVKRPEKTDSILSFLQESGFADTHLELLIKRMPRVLSANLERSIKPKFKFFQDLGFSSSDVVKMVSSHPRILASSVDNRLGPSILALKSVLGSNMDVPMVLKKCGRLLGHDLAKTVIPNIEFMKSCGISSSQITHHVCNFARLFLRKPTSIREYVKRVDEMGFNRKSKLFIEAIRVISSMTKENWELKLEVFKSLGFSEDDILSVFRTQPQAFRKSERKIRAITQLLLSTGKCDISFVVKNPEFLGYSVENRLKPRLRVVEVLESRNLLLKKPSLANVCKMSNKKFFEKYVLPFSNEVGQLFVVNKPPH
ncbi:transcription termination factor MTERF6, chloroplastic/mitochondrial-like [Cornus florida]|uniref:transcription termination factor MTERF6, chloroplastic/mitochondrial-like n=1 Tax=Cornus florida TaxID=4283 RepID=UPI0028A242BC|nr:transcription termination factor MTERF6, chloroplastic/mitochondrial-like [Cornus florida]